MTEETTRAAPPRPSIAKGWWIAFMIVGSLIALDGASGLVAGGQGVASIVESIGQVIAGPLLAAHGALGRRDGRGLKGRPMHIVLALGTCLYVGGMIAGNVGWSAIFG